MVSTLEPIERVVRFVCSVTPSGDNPCQMVSRSSSGAIKIPHAVADDEWYDPLG